MIGVIPFRCRPDPAVLVMAEEERARKQKCRVVENSASCSPSWLQDWLGQRAHGSRNEEWSWDAGAEQPSFGRFEILLVTLVRGSARSENSSITPGAATQLEVQGKDGEGGEGGDRRWGQGREEGIDER